MITVQLARDLAAAGVRWQPTRGDRFVVADRGMDDETFVVSDMVAEVHDRASGQVIGFNGTTEWALDSLSVTETVWLPHEGQLRALLGARFRGLAPRPGGYAVEVDVGGQLLSVADPDAESAYARALLAVLSGG